MPNSTLTRWSASLLLLLGSCANLSYDLDGRSYPISAAPAPAGSSTESFEIKGKSILWVHGLAGERRADVGQELDALQPGQGGIANLRVTQSASFHDWLITHLSLSLIRMKTVRISGELVRNSGN